MLTPWRWPNPRIPLFILLLIIPIVICAPKDERPCTIHSDSKFYDLNPLKSSKDYEFKSAGGHNFVLNVCKSVSHESWGLKVPNPGDVAGFIQMDRGDFSIGETNTTLIMSDGKPKLVMWNGSQCKTANGGTKEDRAATVIEFVCDTSVFGAGKPRLVHQIPEEDDLACSFFIEWNTHFACPTGDRGGPWGFFAVLAVIIIILLMCYIVFGTLYNRYVLQLRGFDQIPQFSIESMKYHGREAINWFRDIMGQLYEGGQRGGWGGGNVPRSWGGFSSGGGGGLSSGGGGAGGFRRPTSRGTNPVSHQSQVDVGGEEPSALDVPNGRGAGAGTGGFVRPSRGPSTTNPVSHQSQVNANVAAGERQHQSSPAPPVQQKRYESGSSTKEERAFMLGDDDDEDDNAVPATPRASNAPSDIPNSAATSVGAATPAQEEQSAAQLRGRDLGDEGVIRL